MIMQPEAGIQEKDSTYIDTVRAEPRRQEKDSIYIDIDVRNLGKIRHDMLRFRALYNKINGNTSKEAKHIEHVLSELRSYDPRDGVNPSEDVSNPMEDLDCYFKAENGGVRLFGSDEGLDIYWLYFSEQRSTKIIWNSYDSLVRRDIQLAGLVEQEKPSEENIQAATTNVA